MKNIKIKWLLFGIAVALLAACSKGSDAPSALAPAAPSTLQITNTVPGKPAMAVAEKSNTIMSAYKNTIENKTIIQICHDLDQDNDCSQLVILTIDGTTAKNYAIDSIESPSQIVYQDDDAVEGIVNHYLSKSGQINVTRLDSSTVEGTFSATVECNSGCTGTVPISGNFNIPLSQ